MKTQPHILDLFELAAKDEQYFGQKAVFLSKAKNAGFAVPKGFSLSSRICARIAKSPSKDRYIRCLSKSVEKLLLHSQSDRMVVRSSSRLEGKSRGHFAGIFDSYLDIRSTEDVILSIEKIVSNSKLEHLATYFEKFDHDLLDNHMAVLIQEQIDPDFSGIAEVSNKFVLLEATHGHLGKIISGSKCPYTYKLDGQSFEIVTTINKPKDSGDFLPSFQELNFSKLLSDFGQCVVEFGLLRGVFYIFQIRERMKYELSFDRRKYLQDRNNEIEDIYGTKAAAMQFFKMNELFSMPLRVINPGADISHIYNIITELFSETKFVTIRFSRGNEIGLPRGFFKSPTEAKIFLQSNYQRDFSTIAHGYIDVARSFELLIGHDFAILEHIPGMWESNSNLHPDVIEVRNNSAKAYIYKKTRKISIGKEFKNHKDFENPISTLEVNEFVELLNHVSDIIRQDKNIKLPINIHAVWDCITETYQCLNIRKGFEPVVTRLSIGEFHLVECLSDLDSWNGALPIRLKLKTDRGSEKSLIQIARRLALMETPLVIDFGILSHPAMVLREYGCCLIPSYQVQDLFDDSTYYHKNLELDFGQDAYKRIIGEPYTFCSENYVVVNDRDPITDHHYLCMMKYLSPSTADTGKFLEVKSIFEAISKVQSDIFFFERGRAPFCSSGFSQPQDHFHLIGGIDITSTFQELINQLGGIHFLTIEDAYSNAPLIGEYCVFGSDVTGYRVSAEKPFKKRILRECVKK